MWDTESAVPLYVQIKERLARQVRSGVFKPHEVLPSERELIEQFGVSRITIRRALSDLVHEGLLYRKMGLGTFVASKPITETLVELVGHLEELLQRNLNPEVLLVEQGFRAPQPDVAEALGDPPGVFFARRVIQVEQAPLLLLDICLPGDLGIPFDVTELTTVPIHRVLERYGLIPAVAEQQVAARTLMPWEAELLHTTAGAPALEVTRTEWSAAGRGLLWSRAVYRGDRYRYVIRLRRTQRSGAAAEPATPARA